MRTKLFAIALSIAFSITSYAQVNLTQNLRLYLPFTGNANDASGNGNVVTVNGPTLTTDRFGTANAAYHFDGVNDFISMINGPGMKPQYPFSFSCWAKVYVTNNGSTNWVFNNDYVVDHYYGSVYNFSSSANGFWCAGVGDGGTPGPSSRNTKQCTTPTPMATWTHFAAVVYSATNMRVFINCQEEPGSYSGTGSGLIYSNTGNAVVGIGDGGGSNVAPTFINADLDEIRFYDRALNDAEIDALYYYPNPPGTDITLGNNIQYICPNGSVTLTPSPAVPVSQWSDGSADQSLTVNCPGIYWVAVTDECGVTTYDTVDVQLAPALQQVNLGPDVTICPGQSVVLNATVANATGYLWSPGGSTQAQLTATAAGTYTVTVSNQCYSSTDAVQVNVSHPAQQLTADPDGVTCYGEDMVLHASAPVGVTLVWSNGQVGNQTTISNPGVYWVNAIDQCGVVADTIYIDLKEGCDSTTALIENFSTNAKVLKDYFVDNVWVVQNMPQHNAVVIYDTQGRLVYQTANYANNWYPMVANGVYYYQLFSDNKLVNNGRIVVKRQ